MKKRKRISGLSKFKICDRHNFIRDIVIPLVSKRDDWMLKQIVLRFYE